MEQGTHHERMGTALRAVLEEAEALDGRVARAVEAQNGQPCQSAELAVAAMERIRGHQASVVELASEAERVRMLCTVAEYQAAAAPRPAPGGDAPPAPEPEGGEAEPAPPAAGDDEADGVEAFVAGSLDAYRRKGYGEPPKQYTTHLRQYAEWCAKEGQPLSPTTPEALARYVRAKGRHHRHTYLQSAISAVGITQQALHGENPAGGRHGPARKALKKLRERRP